MAMSDDEQSRAIAMYERLMASAVSATSGSFGRKVGSNDNMLDLAKERPFKDGESVWAEERTLFVRAAMKDDTRFVGVIAGGETWSDYDRIITSTNKFKSESQWEDANQIIMTGLEALFQQTEGHSRPRGQDIIADATGATIEDDLLAVANTTGKVSMVMTKLDHWYMSRDEVRVAALESKYTTERQWKGKHGRPDERISAFVGDLQLYARQVKLITKRALEMKDPNSRITKVIELDERVIYNRTVHELKQVKPDNKGGYNDAIVDLMRDVGKAKPTNEGKVLLTLDGLLERINEIEVEELEKAKEKQVEEANMLLRKTLSAGNDKTWKPNPKHAELTCRKCGEKGHVS